MYLVEKPVKCLEFQSHCRFCTNINCYNEEHRPTTLMTHLHWPWTSNNYKQQYFNRMHKCKCIFVISTVHFIQHIWDPLSKVQFDTLDTPHTNTPLNLKTVTATYIALEVHSKTFGEVIDRSTASVSHAEQHRPPAHYKGFLKFASDNSPIRICICSVRMKRATTNKMNFKLRVCTFHFKKKA